jgi:hypothetical protein
MQMQWIRLEEVLTLYFSRLVNYEQTTVLTTSVRKLQTSENQNHRHLAIDCSGGYDVVFEEWWSGFGVDINPENATTTNNTAGNATGVMVAPNEVISMGGSGTGLNGSDAFFLADAYECDENNLPVVVPVYEQGDALRICIKPDIRSQENGLYMRRIDSMYLSRLDIPGVIQYAVEGGQEDFYGMSKVLCTRGSTICRVETIIRAEFFASPGVITIGGIATLQFGTHSSRRLSNDHRYLQEEGERHRFRVSFPVTTFQEKIEKGMYSYMSQLQAILLVVLTFIALIIWLMLWWIRSTRRLHHQAMAYNLDEEKVGRDSTKDDDKANICMDDDPEEQAMPMGGEYHDRIHS